MAEPIHRIIAIQEEDDLTDPPEHLKLVQYSFVPSEDQQKLLDDTLAVFPDVLISKPGCTDVVKLSPIRSHPYRVALVGKHH